MSVDFRFLRLYRGYQQYLKLQEILGRTERCSYKEYCQRVNMLDEESRRRIQTSVEY